MLDSIFIIRNADNSLIFYGQLSENQPEDLETVLGQILMKAKDQTPGTQKLVALKQGKFLYGLYPSFCLILSLSKGTEKDVADKILQSLGDTFSTKFQEKVETYSGDNSIFSSFTNDVQEILSSFMSKTPTETTTSEAIPSESGVEDKEEVEAVFGKEEETSPTINSASNAALDQEDTSKTIRPKPSEVIPVSQRKGMIDIKKSDAVVDTFSSEKPLIPPQKRQAFPDGIPDYARDEILFNESFEVQKNFESDLVDFSVSRIKVTLNISLTHLYEVEVDFTNYPERPLFVFSDSLKKELGKPYEEISYFLKHWDPKIPAHITEIVYELEKILTRFKSEGKLSHTQEMPSYVLPDLEPLKNDIKYDPNFKPKEVVIPEFIPEEVKADKPEPISAPIARPGVPVQKAGMPAKTSTPAKQIDPKEQKRLQKEEEQRKKMEEQRKKEEEKQQKKQDEEEAKKRKQLEKLKKQQAKEDREISKRNTEFDNKEEDEDSEDKE